MIWVLFAGLVALAVIIMLDPLRRSEAVAADRIASAVTVHVDQLREIDKDAERGLISTEEAKAAKVEIERRLIALERTKSTTGHFETGGRGALWLSALMVPLIAGALYTQLGSPQIPGVPFADRKEERVEEAQIAELTGRLLERLQSDPEGGPTEGWMLLGQTYMRMGEYADAASAMENVIGRDDATSAMFSQYAQALVAAENGIVSPKARTAIRRARELDPTNPAATFYEAIALDQAGGSEQAHDLLVARLEQAAGTEPWIEIFVAQANRIGEAIGREPMSVATFAPKTDAAPKPTREDLAAASEMSVEDRAAFIRSMVDGLASRLAEDPDDLDGWLRLGNAYRVLGETDKARQAFETAEALAKNLDLDDPRKRSIREALSNLGG